jgi:CubicO group peptidase (beta-lactamase class C family)
LPASEELRAELGRLLRKAQAEHRLPSAAAAVFHGREVVWSDAVGHADVAAGEEASAGHQYRIGSITKTFTAAAVLQLRDAGKLDLDDRLGDHVEEWGQSTPSLRRLLSHLAGLQREPPGEVWETMRLPDRTEFLGGLGRAEQVLDPGARWHYSNLAFALLGEVVERRSGRPYVDHVRERLLEPLGMTRTTWQAAPPVARGYLVEPYTDEVRPERFDVDLAGVAAAGALWSTVADLCRWGAFLSDPDPTVLARETVEEMHAFQAMADRDTWSLGWGLGLMLFRSGDRILAGHNGGMPGHVTYFSYSRKERAGSALFLATSAPSPEVSGLGLELTVRAADAFPAEPEEPWRPATEPPPAELDGVLGRWWSEGYQYVFSFRDGRLRGEHTAAPDWNRRAVFEREAPDLYRAVEGHECGEALRVVRDAQGRVVKLYWATYPFLRQPTAFGAEA